MWKYSIFLLMFAGLICLSGLSNPQWKDSIELKEVVVKSKDKRMLHILAYVRDSSLLYTYTDTAILFREKWIDYMLPPGKKSRFQGWSLPRILSSKSYYHFRNNNGLDSVSDKFNQHFTWSDWIGMIKPIPIPIRMLSADTITDTIFGKYTANQIWHRYGDKYILKLNAMTDTNCRKYIPGLNTFFRPAISVFDDEGTDLWNTRNTIEFDKFKLSYDFRHVDSETLSIRDLEQVTCDVESQGRGRNMFRFNNYDETFYVDTHSEIYFIDKEYITVKEAKKWEKRRFADAEIAALPLPYNVPKRSAEMEQLIARVNALKETDEDNLRAHLKVDRRLAGRPLDGYTNKEVILKILKNMIGIKTPHKYNQN